MQRPHPPCYIVGTGSPETIEIAAELGFGYASVFVTKQRAQELNDNLRERAAHYGHTMRPDQFPLLSFIYVAETQEQAEQEYIGHLQRFFEDYAAHDAAISGAARLSLGRSAQDARRGRPTRCTAASTSRLISDAFFIAVGTPDKVANQIGEWSRDDEDQPHQQRDACRRHAALEDGEEPDAVRRRGDAAGARAAGTAQRVAAE